LAFTFKAETVSASPGDIWVPYNYPTIQAAINAANPGDTIHVAGGIYDPVVVNKSLTLIAEGEAIIDRNGTDGVGIQVRQADHVNIYNFRIQNGSYLSCGISLENASFCNLANNQIRDFCHGIDFYSYVSNSSASNNTIIHCDTSIYLSNSLNNNIVANNIYNCDYYGLSLNWCNSTLIADNNITASRGMEILASLNNTIYNNWVNSEISIILQGSNNTLYNNWINSSYASIVLREFNSLIFHNNFIGSNNQVIIDGSAANNKWYLEWPLGGNFWSNHASPDIRSGQHQDQPGSDAICDNYYAIAEGVIDAYPLMGPCNRFEVQFDPIPSMQEISVVGNSSISAFQMNTTQKTISFNVSGETGVGFCRVDIPNVVVSSLWQNNYRVLVDNQEPLYVRNWTSGTTTYIYLQYQHSTKEVVIVPEFQSALIPILLMLFTTISASIKKLSHRKAH
jgi:parallel beta-helix repeat protein